MAESHMTPRFGHDLAKVATACSPSDLSLDMLDGLGKVLGKWRDECNRRISERKTRLPKDHPVLCHFGIFDTMGYCRLEVAHTRSLAWLLDPRQDHGFGTRFLNALLKQVGATAAVNGDAIDVLTEAYCQDRDGNGTGRADIWVTCRRRGSIRWLLVIEAKVDADEARGQLERYETEIKHRLRGTRAKPIRVFLTPDGSSATCEQWSSLGFSRLVPALLDLFPTVRAKPGFDIFRLYLAGVIRHILDAPIGANSTAENRFALLKLLRIDAPPLDSVDTPMIDTNAYRALGFYLEYYDAMQYWYEERARTAPKGIPNGKTIQQVGRMAELQGSALLLECTQALKEHLERHGCHAKVCSRPDTVQRSWFCRVKAWRKGVKSTGMRWTAGWDLSGDPPCLTLWIWSHGGMSAAAELDRIFGERARRDATPGSADVLVLGKPIPIKVAKDFGLDEEGILDQAHDRIRLIRKADINKWLRL